MLEPRVSKVPKAFKVLPTELKVIKAYPVHQVPKGHKGHLVQQVDKGLRVLRFMGLLEP